MKTLNEIIEEYTCYLQQGELQIAYKGIIDFLGKLRVQFIKKYPHYDVSSIYPGYMDMSFFSLSTKLLKDKGLKIAIVYLHDKGDFEVWLSARNRDIAKTYTALLSSSITDDVNIFHNSNNPDAIIECILSDKPDFEDQSSLIDNIDDSVEKFVTKISNRL